MENTFGNLEVLAARRGTFALNDQSEYLGKAAAVVVSKEGVIEALEINDADVLQEYIADPSATLDPGTVLRPRQVNPETTLTTFSKVKMSSGNCVIYRG